MPFLFISFIPLPTMGPSRDPMSRSHGGNSYGRSYGYGPFCVEMAHPLPHLILFLPGIHPKVLNRLINYLHILNDEKLIGLSLSGLDDDLSFHHYTWVGGREERGIFPPPSIPSLLLRQEHVLASS